MAIVEATKRFECAFFSPLRSKCNEWLNEHEQNAQYEIIPLWDGMTFKGFAVMDENQTEYFSKFFALESPVIGFYDKCAAWDIPPQDKGLTLWGKYHGEQKQD